MLTENDALGGLCIEQRMNWPSEWIGSGATTRAASHTVSYCIWAYYYNSQTGNREFPTRDLPP